jgi:hypothetical protein
LPTALRHADEWAVGTNLCDASDFAGKSELP